MRNLLQGKQLDGEWLHAREASLHPTEQDWNSEKHDRWMANCGCIVELPINRHRDMESESGHRGGGRRRKHKNPAATSADQLDPPRLPEYLKADGPSGDAENESKRPRSTFTTPKS